MTYDMWGSSQKLTGHHTSLYASMGKPNNASCYRSVQILKSYNVPLYKIVIGAAFYGHMWNQVENKDNGLYQKYSSTGSKTIAYTELHEKYIDRGQFKRYWDESAKAPYLFDGTTFISYDDEESLLYKSKYIKVNSLGGIMFWEYSLDRSYTLLDALHRGIQD